MEASDRFFSLFPFVCGVCNAKYNGIGLYFSHILGHNDIKEYLHCCVDASNDPSTAENVYSCSKCQFKFPTLCTLYEHLLEDEILTEFIFRSEEKTAYALNEPTDDTSSVNDYEEDEHEKLDEDVGENVDMFGSQVDQCSDRNVTSKCSPRVSTQTQQTCQVETKENLLNKINFNKKEANSSCNENNTNAIDNVYTNVCEEETSMNESADAFTESGTSSSHKVSRKGASKVDKKLAVDSYYPCEVCGGIYKYHRLREHKAVHAEPTFECVECNFKFSSKQRLAQHKSTKHATEDKYICHECGKSFKAQSYLRQHGIKHRTERPAECQVCHSKFKNGIALRVHMKNHSDVRPYKCSNCDKTFRRAGCLRKHNAYVHSTVKQFPCLECHKMFKNSCDVRKHMQIHRPPKHFCDVCGKYFIQHSNMRIHMKVHSKGELPQNRTLFGPGNNLGV